MTTSSPQGGTHPARAAQPAPRPRRGFLFFLGFAAVGAAVASLASLVLTLPLKALAIDPANSAALLSVASAVGSLFSIVAFPLLGRLSDRTVGRFGRRRPFLVTGALLLAAGAVVTTVAGTAVVLVAGSILTAVGFAATMVAVTAAIPDQIPADRRGPASTVVGLSVPVGVVAGLFLAQLVAPDLSAMILLPAAVGVAGSVGLALTLADRPLAVAERPPFGLRHLFGTYWVSPRTHPDFAWAWCSRLLLYLGVAALQAYQALYLIGVLGFAPAAVAGAIFLSTLVLTAAALILAPIAAAVSDRVGRRKPFVAGAATIFAIGLVLAATAHSFAAFLLATAVLGLGQGVYFAVDIAMITLVLPDPANPAKDLGIMNLASTLPSALVPALAPAVLAIAAAADHPQNYPALFLAGALAGLAGALLILPIRGVR